MPRISEQGVAELERDDYQGLEAAIAVVTGGLTLVDDRLAVAAVVFIFRGTATVRHEVLRCRH